MPQKGCFVLCITFFWLPTVPHTQLRNLLLCPALRRYPHSIFVPEHGCRCKVFLTVRLAAHSHCPNPLFTCPPAQCSPTNLPVSIRMFPALIFSIPSHHDAAHWSIWHGSGVNVLVTVWFSGEMHPRHLYPVCVCVSVCASTCELQIQWEVRGSKMVSFYRC